MHQHLLPAHPFQEWQSAHSEKKSKERDRAEERFFIPRWDLKSSMSPLTAQQSHVCSPAHLTLEQHPPCCFLHTNKHPDRASPLPFLPVSPAKVREEMKRGWIWRTAVPRSELGADGSRGQSRVRPHTSAQKWWWKSAHRWLPVPLKGSGEKPCQNWIWQIKVKLLKHVKIMYANAFYFSFWS